MVAAELREIGCDPHQVEGGLEFAAPLDTLPALVRRLRCASRLLVRMAEGRVDDPAAVAALVARIPWDLLPALPSKVALRLSAHGAPPDRIRWLQAELIRALLVRFGVERVSAKAPTGEADEVALAARLQGRLCTVSVDAGGAPLHQRGWRLEAGPAPLRETLAAAMLRAGGYSGRGVFWDPMCGSGTLAIEAALWHREPPAHLRTYAVDAWRLPFARSVGPGLLRGSDDNAPEPGDGSQARIVAGDLDATVLELAKRNAARAGVGSAIDWQPFEIATQQVGSGVPGFVVANPPYGHRLGGRNAARRLCERLGAVLLRRCVGWRAAILVPEPQLARVLPLAHPETRVLDNGGLKVWLCTGEISTGLRVALRS